MEEANDLTFINTNDGLKLNYIISNCETPKAVVCLLHGHGEHIGRYDHVMSSLAKNGIASVGLNLRGHGHSEGKRGHITSINQVLDDVEEGLKLARVNFLDLPLFLFGHSYGGCIALSYVLKKPLNELTGFIASSPWLELAFEPPKWKTQLGEVLAKTLPSLTLKSELDPKLLSKDESVEKQYVEDPLVHNRISAGFFSSVTRAGKYVSEKAKEIKLEGLIYHGDADRIISHDATKKACNDNPVLIFKTLNGVYHEPHNDNEKEDVLELLVNWILKKVS